MASPPIPPSLEHLATRPFSFYPPIIGVEHNEWLFRKATWSEILVVNCKSSVETWIPRRFMGEVSRVDDPVTIVGLVRELEFKGGSVWPYQRRVIEMPLAVGGFPIPPSEAADRGRPAPIVGIRLETNDKRIVRLIGAALVVFIGLCVFLLNMTRVGEVRQRAAQGTATDQQFLDLTSRDDYFMVVQKLGTPASDRWQNTTREIQYRALSYPDRHYTVILMGPSRNEVRYVGAMDDKWTPVHSVELHSGGTTSSLLRSLQRF